MLNGTLSLDGDPKSRRQRTLDFHAEIDIPKPWLPAVFEKLFHSYRV
jgi:hypothetical protein